VEYGKRFVDLLCNELNGFWYKNPTRPFDTQMLLAVGYYYELSQYRGDKKVSNLALEAVTRQLHENFKVYGQEIGLQRTLGGLESIRSRVNLVKAGGVVDVEFSLVPGGYFDFDDAYEQSGLILNPWDSSWLDGLANNRPSTWGHVDLTCPRNMYHSLC
jgi:hypothetical protein